MSKIDDNFKLGSLTYCIINVPIVTPKTYRKDKNYNKYCPSLYLLSSSSQWLVSTQNSVSTKAMRKESNPLNSIVLQQYSLNKNTL